MKSYSLQERFSAERDYLGKLFGGLDQMELSRNPNRSRRGASAGLNLKLTPGFKAASMGILEGIASLYCFALACLAGVLILFNVLFI